MMTAEASCHLSNRYKAARPRGPTGYTRYTYALQRPHENQLLFRTSRIAGSLRSAGPQLYIIITSTNTPALGQQDPETRPDRAVWNERCASSQSPAAGLLARVVVFVRLRST